VGLHLVLVSGIRVHHVPVTRSLERRERHRRLFTFRGRGHSGGRHLRRARVLLGRGGRLRLLYWLVGGHDGGLLRRRGGFFGRGLVRGLGGSFRLLLRGLGGRLELFLRGLGGSFRLLLR